jgi:hypothetical protein
MSNNTENSYFKSGRKCVLLFDIKKNNFGQSLMDTITNGSHLKCWYKCDNTKCNHSFMKQIKAPTGCPYCCIASKKICNFKKYYKQLYPNIFILYICENLRKFILS